jgi:hypothetical protein
MDYIETKRKLLSNGVFVLIIALAIMTGALISQLPYMAVGLFIFLALIFACIGNPLRATYLLIMFFPFSETEYFRDRIIDLPGAKPIFMLGMFAVIVMLTKRHDVDALPKMGRNFLIAVIALFSIAIFRAFPNLDFINLHFAEELNSLRFFLSFYVKPLIYLLPFFVVAKLIKSSDDLQILTNAITIALSVLSLVVIYVFTINVGTAFDPVVATEAYSEYFGMHRNDLATFFVLGLPLVLYGLNIQRNIVRLLAVVICLIGIGILFSRTAYLTTLITFLAYSLFMNKHRLISWALFVVLILSLVFNNVISDRASKGLVEGDINTLAAGRIEQIWTPLLYELAKSPSKLLFGSGRYAIAYSDSAQNNSIQFVFHPHNMYLEQLLDIGLVGILVFWATLLAILKKLYRLARQTNNELRSSFAKVLLISLLCFFVSGLTGRTLFPELPASYLWLILGSAVALLKIDESSGLHEFHPYRQ